MAVDNEGIDDLIELYAEQRPRLYRLARLLGASTEAGPIVRSAFRSLHRRSRRLIDPQERVEYLTEQVVHLARTASGEGVEIPDPDDGRYLPLIERLRRQSASSAEILVVSHFMTMFGPELSRVMRLTVHRSNQRLESALEELASDEGEGEQINALSADLTAALNSIASQIKVPPAKPLEPVLQEASSPERGSVRGQLVAVASIVALAVGSILAVGTQRESAVAPEPVASTTVEIPTPTTQSAVQAVVRSAPMYYVGRTDGKLYREYRDLPSTASLSRTGIESLITLVPLDPDYVSLWTGKYLGSTLHDGVLTVDLSADAYSSIEPDKQQAAIEQMVYTMSELLERPGLVVHFHADGSAAPAPFNVSQGYRRHGLGPMPGLWITSPRNQDVTPSGTLSIQGTVRPEYGAPTVTLVHTETQEVVSSSIAQTGLAKNDEGWLIWSVMLSISEPGTYEVRAAATARGLNVAGQPNSVSETKLVRVAD
ncbi:GerMN domain-containing protein [uncultured Tessaracoccus sp.]|uniref:GerMN domain-containing protein n=1 Tax=uncultured Tessaracoccus sp. TaxID=905023 RepID=UPI0026327732|nr:GerMN domain-containing protein [uncultured Tessaracoccus sp.]